MMSQKRVGGAKRRRSAGVMARDKKGLTPIIAVILLLMMTVAAAGAAFFWFIRIQGELQGGSEQFTSDLGEKLASNVEVILAEYTAGSSQGNLTLILKNVGGSSVPLSNSAAAPTSTIILKNSESNLICSSDWSSSGTAECTSGCGASTTLGVNSVATVILNLTSTCDISNSTTYPTGSTFWFSLDLSGEVGTGGQFEK